MLALAGNEKKNIAKRTVKPAMVTTSVYCSPVTAEVASTPKLRVNPDLRSFEVELADGSYDLCPEQDDPQLVDGTKRSLLPVSKSTVL